MKQAIFKSPKFFVWGLAVLCASFSMAQNSNNNIYGTSGNDNMIEYIVNSDGSMYLCGTQDSQASLMLIDECGDIVFSKRYAFSGLTAFSSMTKADNGDILMTRQLNSDWYVTRVDALGNVLWSKSYHNRLERGHQIIKSTGDSYFIVGWYAQFGISDDITILKIDGSGTPLWTKRFHQIDDQTYDAVSDGNGGLVICGGLHSTVDMFVMHVDASGNVVASREFEQQGIHRFECRSITRTSDGNYLGLGVSSASSAWNPTRMTILKMNPSFGVIWQKDFNVGSNFGATGIQEGSNGHIYFSSKATWASNHYMITELDASGSVVQAKEFPQHNVLYLNRNEVNTYNDKIIALGNTLSPQFGGASDALVNILELDMNTCNTVDVTPSLASVSLISKPFNYSTSTVNFIVTPRSILATDALTQVNTFCGEGCCPEITIEMDTCNVVYSGYSPAECVTLQPTQILGGLAPYTYAWSTGEITAAILACPNSTTTYTLVVTDANGCEGTIDVTVNVQDVSCGNKGDKVELCHMTNNGSVILCVSPASVPSHLAHGDYLGACGQIDPCIGAAKSANLPIDQDEFEQHTEFSVYPTLLSSEEQLNVDYHGVDGAVTLTIYDLSGKVLSTIVRQSDSSESQHFEIDVNNLNNGAYLCRLTNEFGVSETARFVVMR